jgi:hypothetical protein
VPHGTGEGGESRRGKKIRWSQGRVGSTPSAGTTFFGITGWRFKNNHKSSLVFEKVSGTLAEACLWR